VYEYFENLLAQNGFTTQTASREPSANLQTGTWSTDVFASLTMRQYPGPGQANYYRQVDVFLRQPPSVRMTKAEITFSIKNGLAAEGNSSLRQTAPSPTSAAATLSTPTTKQKGNHLSFPPPRGTWDWAIQSVAIRRGAETKYTSFYYEASTDRSVDKPLTLPSGARIVGVFPDDCMFSVRDELGHSFTFRNQDEAKARGLGPGTWSVYPIKCGGVAVFLR